MVIFLPLNNMTSQNTIFGKRKSSNMFTHIFHSSKCISSCVTFSSQKIFKHAHSHIYFSKTWNGTNFLQTKIWAHYKRISSNVQHIILSPKCITTFIRLFSIKPLFHKIAVLHTVISFIKMNIMHFRRRKIYYEGHVWRIHFENKCDVCTDAF